MNWNAVGAAAALAAALVPAPPVRAHTPHHDVYQLEVSPDFASGRTLYAVVRGNLLRSEDAGATWRRLVRGLDHEHILAGLAVAPSDPTVL